MSSSSINMVEQLLAAADAAAKSLARSRTLRLVSMFHGRPLKTALRVSDAIRAAHTQLMQARREEAALTLRGMQGLLLHVEARGLAPDLIFDVGAHRGHWTRLATAVFPNARVVMVEPQAEMEAELSELCRSGRHEWIRAGAGARPGDAILGIYGDADLVGSSYVADYLPPGGTWRATSIVTLDSLANARGIPDVVKLDVQGFELEVLKGAEALFGSTELFIVEVYFFRFSKRMSLVSEVVRFMADRGYEIYDVAEILPRPWDGALGQADIAFARREGILRNTNSWSGALPASWEQNTETE
jgi:FkbM family methyltransferase